VSDPRKGDVNRNVKRDASFIIASFRNNKSLFSSAVPGGAALNFSLSTPIRQLWIVNQILVKGNGIIQ
jgi:hypothetical protein